MTETTAIDPSTELLEKLIAEVPDGERIRLCLQCGSCSGICPFGFAMDFPPRSIVAAMRVRDVEPVLKSDSVWLCVSCFACSAHCPAKIPLTEGLLSTVKSELLLKGEVPEELQLALENSRRYGNTLGESPRKRGDWAMDLDPPVPVMARHNEPVDVLWYVGDYASYHPRVQQVSVAMAKIFQALGVKFGILGPEEQSDGDAQGLAGEHGLLELLAGKNAKAFAKYEFKEIVTTDPHAYNAIHAEYPRFGYSAPIRHSTQFLHSHLQELKPLLKKEQKITVTYHDPCALGRAYDNNIYEEPRELLKAIPGVELVEMSHNRSESICCGGGGGGMWLDGFSWERAQTRTSEWRIAEAVATGAEVLAVACPYETPRFDDAVKSTGKADALKVKDIAELLAASL